jgi:ribosomal protein S27AE
MVIPFATIAFTTRRLLQRECPICGHTQMVAPSQLRDPITCERCDYLIPAKRRVA